MAATMSKNDCERGKPNFYGTNRSVRLTHMIRARCVEEFAILEQYQTTDGTDGWVCRTDVM